MVKRFRSRITLLATATAWLGLAALGTTQIASADGPSCRRVHARVFLQAEESPTCGSPIGLCAGGELIGSLSGRSSFVGTSFVSTVATASTAVAVLTGDNRIETAHGTILTKDTIALKTIGNGEFAEIDEIVGGTGQFAGATGTLTGTGTFIDGAGEALLVGEICTP